jgi:hypothetical protein
VKRWNKYTIVSLILIICIVVFDQILKVWVKSDMQLGEIRNVIGNWFYLYFVENEGMAFGISFGAKAGKVILTLLRIGVVSFLIYYVLKLVKEDEVLLAQNNEAIKKKCEKGVRTPDGEQHVEVKKDNVFKQDESSLKASNKALGLEQEGSHD